MSDERTLDSGSAFDRKPSPVGSTDAVPAGTLIQVPATPLTGPTGSAPVVAVNNRHWYQDPAFLSAAGGALLSLAPVVVDALQAKTFEWKTFAAGCILALVAYLRSQSNSVIGRSKP